MHRVEVVPRIISSVALSFRFDDRCKMFAYANKHWAHDSLLSLLLASGVRHNCERDFCLIVLDQCQSAHDRPEMCLAVQADLQEDADDHSSTTRIQGQHA